jgi:5'-AMP-activated protein kinase regulatory gamma subunit
MFVSAVVVSHVNCSRLLTSSF